MKRTSGGFTLIEALAIVVVAGVLAAAGIGKFTSLLNIKKLDGESRALYSAIAYAHAQVLRKDFAYIVVFDKVHNSYSLYEDRNGDGVAAAGELISTTALNSRVEFGVASGGPAKGPGGTGVPSAKVESAWTTGVYLDRDRAATINAGSVYLCAPKVKTRTYCIRMPAGSRTLQIWRWDGSQWLAL